LQETRADQDLDKTITKEFPQGDWFHSFGSGRGRGAAIYIAKKLKLTYLHDSRINDWNRGENKRGRLVAIGVEIGSKKYIIVSIYAPNTNSADQRAESREFLAYARGEIQKVIADGYTPIIAGDFNFIRDPFLDAPDGEAVTHDTLTDWLRHFEHDFCVVDLHRYQQPDKQLWTWSNGNGTSGPQRRLDYIIVPMATADTATQVRLLTAPNTDHRMVKTRLMCGIPAKPGPGLWKHNDEHLKNPEYVNLITNVITEELKEEHTNKAQAWEAMKYQVKKAARKWSLQNAQSRREARNKAEQRYCNATTCQDPDKTEIINAKAALDKYYSEEDDIIRFRASIDKTESGEKVTPYMFRQIRQNQGDSNVTKLRKEDGTITTEPADIQDIIHTHYSRQFSKDDTQHPNEDWLNQLPRMSPAQASEIERDITPAEVTNVLHKDCHPGKSPGNDGLTILFYRQFWPQLNRAYMDMLRLVINEQEMTQSQKQSVIKLIAKKNKDTELLTGWRPISLMNVDAKIYAKVLAKRMTNVLPDIIGGEQLGYMAGRYIGENSLILQAAIQQAKADEIAYLLSIDFKAAFDSVSHDYLWTVMEKNGFPQVYINYVKTLYQGAESCIINSGTTTHYFPLEKSCRQGDPIAAYLFILGLEPLIQRLKRNLEGLKIGNTQIKIGAYADDIWNLVKTPKEVELAVNIIEKFKSISGLCINYNKSEILPLHNNENAKEIAGIRTVNKLKICGITFSRDHTELLKENWEMVLSKVTTKLNMWKGRDLSVVGKSTVINAQILPIIMYTGAVLDLPQKYSQKLTKQIINFVWKGSEKIPRATSHLPFEKGGLNIPLLNAKAAASKAKIIKNYLMELNLHGKQYFITPVWICTTPTQLPHPSVPKCFQKTLTNTNVYKTGMASCPFVKPVKKKH
jgi:hypothetical protein